ncbi:MAG: hypothetical protein Q8Q91_01055, partial [Candidatus Daviesbacteria bacterium]|nr:hypothetical protein [Candidatus Daviesbacteria bacterium]
MKTLKRLRIEKDIVTRVHRTLKARGQLNISLGQEVAPDDIIGSCWVSSGFRIVNLSQVLSVSPGEAKKYLKREIGQKIYKGELLAFKKQGFLGGKKMVISPSDGILEYLNEQTGELRLNFLPKKIDLPAAVYGVVEEIDIPRGDIVIKTEVSRIYGMFGTGKNREGTLNIIGRRDELIGELKITAENSDQILVGGSLIRKEAISQAISSGVCGIIAGGINAGDYKAMAGGRLIFPKKLENDIGVSVVICEGFGVQFLGEDIYGVLQKYNGKFVLLDGNHAIINLPSFESNCMRRVKSIALPKQQNTVVEVNELKLQDIKIGPMVRVVGNSYSA